MLLNICQIFVVVVVVVVFIRSHPPDVATLDTVVSKT